MAPPSPSEAPVVAKLPPGGDVPRVAGVAPPPMAPRADASPPAAPALESAPDLGIVPLVIAEAFPAPVPGVAAPSVATPAVEREVAAATAIVPTETPEAPKPVEEPSVPSAAVPDLATAEKASEGGEAPADDAPKDNAPPSAPPEVHTAATARPEVGNDRPAVDRHLVVRQVADRIESLVAARPRDGVTIHLEPRDLGTVTLVVKGLASSLDVQMFASDDRVRQSLDASRPELAQALAPRNIEIRELRVADAPSSTPSRDAGSNPDGRPRGQAHPQQGFSPRSAKAAPEPRAARRSGRGVDLLV